MERIVEYKDCIVLDQTKEEGEEERSLVRLFLRKTAEELHSDRTERSGAVGVAELVDTHTVHRELKSLHHRKTDGSHMYPVEAVREAVRRRLVRFRCSVHVGDYHVARWTCLSLRTPHSQSLVVARKEAAPAYDQVILYYSFSLIAKLWGRRREVSVCRHGGRLRFETDETLSSQDFRRLVSPLRCRPATHVRRMDQNYPKPVWSGGRQDLALP